MGGRVLAMSIRLAVVLSLAAIYPASFDRTPDPSSEFGCPGWGEGEVDHLVLLNGEVVDRERLEALPHSEIAIFEIICWDIAKVLFDVDVRLGVTSVWTHPTPLDFDLAELAKSEEAYREIHGHYTASLVDLTDFRPQARISFKINVADDGWSATARHHQIRGSCSFSHEYDAERVPGHGPVCTGMMSLPDLAAWSSMLVAREGDVR